MRSFNRLKSVGVLSLMVFAAAAQAHNFTYMGLIANKKRDVQITYNGKVLNVQAGVANVSLSGTAIQALCVDLDHWNTAGSSYNVEILPIDQRGPFATRASWLFTNRKDSVDSADKGAALQLAVWDILYDGGDGLTAGSFRSNVSGSLLSQTNVYLMDSINKADNTASYFRATSHGANNSINQNHMGIVPEPATMLALGAGIAALLRRRKTA